METLYFLYMHGLYMEYIIWQYMEILYIPYLYMYILSGNIWKYILHICMDYI